jgi:hypothetical protein
MGNENLPPAKRVMQELKAVTVKTYGCVSID